MITLYKTLKTISWVVLIFYGSMQVTYAMPQSNSLATVSSGVIEPYSGSVTQNIVQNPSNLNIPSEYVDVKDIHRGSNDKLIIHIQDAHSNLSGQENIANALDALMSEYPIPIVLSEGGEGDASLGQIKESVAKKDLIIGAKRLLLEGLISGHEYLNLTKEYPMRIIGIEKNSLYDQNLDAYVDLKDERKEALSFLRKINISIQRIKNQLYPKELLEYENSKEVYKYSPVSQGDSFNAIRLAQKIGLEIDAKSQIHKLMRLESEESKTGLDIEQINLELLLTELNELDGAIHDHYLQTTQQQTLHSIDLYVGLLQKAYMIQLNSDEFKRIKELSPLMQPIAWQAFINQNLAQLGYYDGIVIYNDILEKTHSKIIRFYNLVHQRDMSFIENINQTMIDTNQSIAFLIAGGYHTQHLTELLKNEGYSYIVLTPHIEYETDHSQYEKGLLASIQTAVRDTLSMALAGAPGGRSSSRLTTFINENPGIAATQIAVLMLKLPHSLESLSNTARMSKATIKRILDKVEKSLASADLNTANTQLLLLEEPRSFRDLTDVQKFKTLVHRTDWQYQQISLLPKETEASIEAAQLEIRQIKLALNQAKEFMGPDNQQQKQLFERIANNINTYESQLQARINTLQAEQKQAAEARESLVIKVPPAVYEADIDQLKAALTLTAIKSGKWPPLLKAIADFMLTNKDRRDMLENKASFIKAAATTIFKNYRGPDGMAKAKLFAEYFSFEAEGETLATSAAAKPRQNPLILARNAKIKEITDLYVKGISKRQAHVDLLNGFWFGSFIKLVVSHYNGLLFASLADYKKLAINEEARAVAKAANAVADNIRRYEDIQKATKELIEIEQQINPKKPLNAPSRMAKSASIIKRALERIAKALASGALEDADAELKLYEEPRKFKDLTNVQKFKMIIHRSDWRIQKANNAAILNNAADVEVVLLEVAAIEELLEEAAELYMEPDHEQQLESLHSIVSKMDAFRNVILAKQKQILEGGHIEVSPDDKPAFDASEEVAGTPHVAATEQPEDEVLPSVYEANPEQLKAALKLAGIKTGKLTLLLKAIADFMATHKDNVLVLENKAGFIRAAANTIFKTYGQSATEKATLFATAFSFSEEGEEEIVKPKLQAHPLLEQIKELEKKIMQIFTKNNRENMKHVHNINFIYGEKGLSFFDIAARSSGGLSKLLREEVTLFKRDKQKGNIGAGQQLIGSLKYLIKIVNSNPEFVAAIRLRRELLIQYRQEARSTNSDGKQTPARLAAQLILPVLITDASQLALNAQDAPARDLIRLVHSPLTPKSARFAYAHNADAFLTEVASVGAMSFIGSNNRVVSIRYPKPSEPNRYEYNQFSPKDDLPTTDQTSAIAQSDDDKFIQSVLAAIVATHSNYQIQDIIWVYEDNASYGVALDSVERLVTKLGGKFTSISESDFFQRLGEFESNARHRTFILPDSLNLPNLNSVDWGTKASFWIIPRSKREAESRFAAMPIIGVITALALYINIFDQQILDNPETTAHPQVVGRLAQRTGVSISEARAHIQEATQTRVLNTSFMQNAKQYLLTTQVLLENLQTWLRTQLATAFSA